MKLLTIGVIYVVTSYRWSTGIWKIECLTVLLTHYTGWSFKLRESWCCVLT